MRQTDPHPESDGTASATPGGASRWPAPVRWSVLGVGVAAVVGMLVFSPRMLAGLDVFDVRRVEVVGTRYLAPHDVLERSGITRQSSVFDDVDRWRGPLLEHPLVDSVRVERRLPHTIVLRVREVVPVAWVKTPELRMVDGGGRVLPVRPAGLGASLPIIGLPSEAGPNGRLKEPEAIALVRAIDRIRRMEPAVAARISEADTTAEGGMRLFLRAPAQAEVVLPTAVDRVRLRQLRLTLADLVARNDLPRVRRIDLQYRDQVVVTLSPSASS